MYNAPCDHSIFIRSLHNSCFHKILPIFLFSWNVLHTKTKIFEMQMLFNGFFFHQNKRKGFIEKKKSTFYFLKKLATKQHFFDLCHLKKDTHFLQTPPTATKCNPISENAEIDRPNLSNMSKGRKMCSATDIESVG